MKPIKFSYLLPLLFICSCANNFKNADFYRDTTSYRHSNNLKKDISQIVEAQRNNEFSNTNEIKLFTKLDNEHLWFHKPISNQEQTYFTVAVTYITYIKVYVVRGDRIIPLDEINSYSKFPHENIYYRHPTWELPDIQKGDDLFIEIQNNSGRARLEFYLENQNDFLKRVETEYFLFGGFIIFLLLIVIGLLFFALSRKRYSIILYAIYILCILVEFLAGKGLGVQYLWSESHFLVSSARSFIQTIGVASLALFYSYFYYYSKRDLKIKKVFIGCAFFTIPFLLVYLYKAFVPSFPRFYLWVWIAMKLVIVVFLVNHFLLARKGRLPIYLVVGFTIPLLAMLLSQYINPSIHVSWYKIKFISNIYYIGLIIEIIVFTYFIFSTILDAQRNIAGLKQANEELKTTFNQNLLEAQEKERDFLLSEVHDTFGGYIAALRIRLQDNANVETKVTLDAFNRDYRYLLNNLYTPKINGLNFSETIIKYLAKMNSLTSIDITHEIDLKNIHLPQSLCIHIYRTLSELITNALKHANASKIKITLEQQKSKNLYLVVSDNGIGFNATLLKADSYGLENVKTRVNKINGTLKIESSNKGSTISLIIPTETQEEK